MSDQIEQLTEEERLREALEAEKREANAAFCLEVQLRQAAEARVRDLEAELAAANALLGRIPDCLLTDCPAHADLVAYRLAHLSSQPAAPDYQAAIDQEHRLACEWKARFEAECAEHSVTKDRLTARAEAAEGLPG